MSGPLTGFRIIDLSVGISGPYAAMILGDQGADVIKVEPVGFGELMRLDPGVRGDGLTPSFVNANRSKRSLPIDLKSERGVEVLCELVKTADVLIQNFRPGTADRMGIGEAVLRAIRPELIYVSISGFGEKGPMSQQRVWDAVVQAMSGMMATQGAGGRPQSIRTLLPDKVTAQTTAQAITAALLTRSQSGEGQHVRISMLDACIAWMWTDTMMPYTWVDDEAGDLDESAMSFDFCFETQTDYIACMIASDSEWQGLCRAAEKPEWAIDERLKTQEARYANFPLFHECLTDLFRTGTAEEWLEKLAKEQLPCAPVLKLRQLIDHPQVVASGILMESDHPGAGRIREARPPVRFDRTPAEPERPAPGLGEHTDEILSELGLSSDQIASLRTEGVVS